LSADWHAFCRVEGFEASARHLDVSWGTARRHRIYVDETPDAWRLWAHVAGRSTLDKSGLATADIWLKNRVTDLVGYRLDASGKLMGESWVPKPGLTAEEFRTYARTLAIDCDRFEFQLSGRDIF
jgi:hypothetical protein